MKKIFLMLLCAVLALSFLLTSCKSETADGDGKVTEENAPVSDKEEQDLVEDSKGKIPAGTDLTKLYDELVAMYEQAPPMIIIDEVTMRDYYGIEAEKCKQAVVYCTETGITADEIWLIEAVDETAAEELALLANNNLSNKIASFKDYMPEEYEVAKEGKVIVAGSYVFLIVSPHVDAMQEYIDSLK